MIAAQFKWVTRESSYHLFIALRNCKSQVVELVQRLTTMLNILYFSGGNQFFRISPRIKSLYDRGRKCLYLLAEDTKFGEGILAKVYTGEVTGAPLTGALGHGPHLALRRKLIHKRWYLVA